MKALKFMIGALLLTGIQAVQAQSAPKLHCFSTNGEALEEISAELTSPTELKNIQMWFYFEGRVTLLQSLDSSKASVVGNKYKFFVGASGRTNRYVEIAGKLVLPGPRDAVVKHRAGIIEEEEDKDRISASCSVF